MVLSKALTLFERDEKGDLVPQEVKLEVDEKSTHYEELKDETIKIVPMTRGEIKRVFSSLDGTKDTEKDIDEDVIVNHCVEPSYTKEDAKFLKSEFSGIIVTTILKHSGLDIAKGKQEALTEAEDSFAKN